MNIVDSIELARTGDADWLSLALIDARNHTLRWLAAFESARAADAEVLQAVAGAALFQHAWIADGGGGAPDTLQALRPWLADTLEEALDRLSATAPARLDVFRAALALEDELGEQLPQMAAARQQALADDTLMPAPPARPRRDALWFPSQRLMLGSAHGGTVPALERWAHEVAVPEFEIDAQAVCWAQLVEFAEDGGYDRRELWSDAGWDWQQAQARRAPRDVEQLRGGVLVQRRGRLQRAAPGQPAVHVTRHEAEAWCRWAGRRLPTEPEWEAAVLAGASRGFAWGDVHEWVAGRARLWPGFEPEGPWRVSEGIDLQGLGVLRGASWMTRPRQRHPKARRFEALESDTMFCGFRSCSL